jgi:choline-sulfatase
MSAQGPIRSPVARSRPGLRVLAAAVLAVAAGAGVLVWRARSGPSGEAGAAGPNVLLVTIDTLRWDRLGCYGDAGASTPVLDALARRGTRFETAMAHVPLTAPSHASILTGLTPLRHGVRDNGSDVLPVAVPALAARFKDAGYDTAAFISGYPLDHRFGFASGFDRYDDRLPRGDPNGRRSYTERRADATTSRARAWLDEVRTNTGEPGAGAVRRPWFMWVHYFDPHAPYEPPGDLAARFAGRPYDGEVAFVDAQLGRLLEGLDRPGEPARTVVLVTADHGESLGEHDEETHGVFVYDATLRVPFIVAGPGVRAGQVATVVARGVDIVSTLIDLSGLPSAPDLDGRSLRPALEGRAMGDEAAYVESLMAQRHLGWAALRGLRSAAWKYVEAPRPELYDLAADAGEQRNRFAEEADRAASLSRQLGALVRASPPVAPAVQTDRRGDREASERLRALGYLGGGLGAPAAPSGRDPKDGIRLINTLERGVAETKSHPRRAIPMLTAVLAEDPDISLARRALALAHVELGEHAAAIAEIERLRAQGAATADDLLVLSESLRVTGRSRQAREMLADATRLDPGSPEPALTEARVLMSERQLGGAAAAFDRALAVAPENPEALVGLGDIALARGDASGAGGYFERARARDPNDPVAALRLAVLRAREGRLGEAVPLFQLVVEGSPRNAEALAGLAAALARTGRPAEAVPYFERAVEAGLRTPAVLNGLGFARLEAGNVTGALEALRLSLALRADQPQVAHVVRQLSAPGGR